MLWRNDNFGKQLWKCPYRSYPRIPIDIAQKNKSSQDHLSLEILACLDQAI